MNIFRQPFQPFPVVWENVRSTLTFLLTDLPRGLTYEAYMKLYSEVFQYLCSEKPDHPELYNRVRQLLQVYVTSLVRQGKKMNDEQLLSFFRARWNDYILSTKIGNNILAYLNRTWIKNHKHSVADVYEINVLAVVIWRDHLFLPLKDRLAEALLRLIERDRNGEQVSQDLIKDTIACYVRIGLQDRDSSGVPATASDLSVYLEHFQDHFIKSTSDYYSVESAQFLVDNGVPLYMRRVNQRMEQEINRVRAYLDSSTEAPLVKKLEDVLIKAHMEALTARFTDLLREDRIDDLGVMYVLLKRVGGLEPLKLLLEKHIHTVGLTSIDADVDNASEKPDVFVNILLQVFRKFSHLIKIAFQDDPGFVLAQDRAFKAFVNTNSVTKKAGPNAVPKAPQMLAKYTDMILRKGPMHIADDTQMSATCDDIVKIFYFLPDKDIFSLVYSKLLSKRLINDISANDDFEVAMINKLKAAQGFEYCMRLQRMIQDITVSKDINTEFRTFLDDNNSVLSVDFTIYVLATGSWPLQAPNSNFNIPRELEASVSTFQTYYSRKYQGRKLTYLHHLSKAEIIARCLLKGKLRCTVSTFQMGILLHFNTVSGDSASFKELLDATQLQSSVLKAALMGLVKTLVLKCSSGVAHADWVDDSVFSINTGFKSKRNRLNCNIQVEVTDPAAKTGSVEPLEIKRDRELKLQAAIVRIMKARKTMTHNELVSETTVQVSKWFKPQMAIMKKVIEALIESEYLKRATDENNSSIKRYEYQA